MENERDFTAKRAHLAHLSDEELYQRFWQLTEKVVEPLLEAGKIYTTPAIERSVLLRMGFSSVEVRPIVAGVTKLDLMRKGCGNVVWRLANHLGITVREAGLALGADKYWDVVPTLFAEEDKHEAV